MSPIGWYAIASVVGIPLSIVAVYVLVRVASAAYFRSKQHFEHWRLHG